jgi:hypothetical protein
MDEGSPPTILASQRVERRVGASVREPGCVHAGLTAASQEVLSVSFFLRELVYALM